jgi:predicted dehydrogenase
MARDGRFELVACADPDEAARAAFAARWSVPSAAADPGALTVQPAPYDVIVVASPTAAHAQSVLIAHSMNPRLVFCEKPVADNLSDAQSLAALYAGSGTPLAVNYTRRWAPDLAEFASQIEAGWWGALISATGTYTKGIVHNGTHVVDLLHMLVGEVELHAVGPARIDYWQHDPTASALLTARNGAPVHLISGDARAVTQFELILAFEKGEIAMRDGGMRIETRAVEANPTFAGYRQLGLPQSVPGRYPEAMARAYDNIADFLAHGAPLASTGENALCAHAICEDIRVKALEDMKKDPA